MAAPQPSPDPLERLLDLTVFAPLGLALSVGDWVAALAERGRGQIEGQLPAARLVGEIAVRQGRKRAESALAPLRHQIEQALADWTRPDVSGSRAGASAAYAPGSESGGGPGRRAGVREAQAGQDGRAEAHLGAPATAAARPDASRLPIPGYDTLSASQVVQRLEGLSAEELDAVRAYEQSGRARKTIMTRAAQLRAASR